MDFKDEPKKEYNLYPIKNLPQIAEEKKTGHKQGGSQQSTLQKKTSKHKKPKRKS
jgi:hypothetical protein